MPQDQKQILESGFDGYLTKPLNIKGFVETVEKFIGKPKAS
jgi:CheY-like chemotaxis protein